MKSAIATQPEYKVGKPLYRKFENIPQEWRIIKLIDLCKSRPRYGAPVAGLTRNESLPRYIRITDITDDGLLRRDEWASITNEDSRNYILSEGDIIFARTGSIGKTYVYRKEDGRCAFAGYLIKFVPDDKKLDVKYLHYYTQSTLYWSWLKSISTVGVQPNVNAELYSNMPVVKPTIREQQKISSILTKVDELIQKTDQIIEQIQRLKKGLMQKLLTSGIGHTKFKKTRVGKIPEKWELVKVREVTESIVPGRNKPKKFDGTIPWITIADLDEMDITDSKKGLRVTREEVKNSAGKIIPLGSVIMTCVGEFGKAGIATREMVLNQQLHAYVCSERIIPFFLALNIINQKKYMYSISTKTTIPYMNKTNCENVPVILPSIHEQKRITEIISLINTRIQKEKSLKYLIEHLKIGLMQNLLTGKIRVKI